MNNTKLLIGLAVAVVIVGGIWLLSTNSSQTSQSATIVDTTVAPEQTAPQDTTTTIPSPAPAPSPSGVKEFTVTGQNFSFTPSAITVQKGDTVKITFKNANGMHDLRIDEFDVATKKIGSGTEDSVQFVADKAGTFEYYCSVGKHRAMGMKGTLVVE